LPTTVCEQAARSTVTCLILITTHSPISPV
jgi:hypothetical protein